MRRLCVFCGSSPGNVPAFGHAARELGETIAARGLELVYGGARVGLMGMLADAALARGGKVIGVLPRFMALKELAHEGLTQLHLVESMHERKKMMADLSDGFIALPGGLGTLEEIFEAMTWAQLHLHPHPCGFLNVAGYYDALMEFLRHATQQALLRPDHLKSLIVTTSIDELLSRFEAFQPDRTEKWFSTEKI